MLFCQVRRHRLAQIQFWMMWQHLMGTVKGRILQKWGEWRGGCYGNQWGHRRNTLCHLTPKTKESKSIATTTPASTAAPIQKTFMMRQYTSTELIDIASKFQQKTREKNLNVVSVVMGFRMGLGAGEVKSGIFLTGWKAEKMSSITTHPALWQCLPGIQGGKEYWWFKVLTSL